MPLGAGPPFGRGGGDAFGDGVFFAVADVGDFGVGKFGERGRELGAAVVGAHDREDDLFVWRSGGCATCAAWRVRRLRRLCAARNVSTVELSHYLPPADADASADFFWAWARMSAIMTGLPPAFLLASAASMKA